MHKSRRLELHEKLVELLGSRNVYFQPPETLKLKFPCIIYNYELGDTIKANDRNYRIYDRYQITYVTKDPEDSKIDEFLEAFQMINHDRHFTSDNLNHYIYSLFY